MQDQANFRGSIFYSSVQPGFWDLFLVDPRSRLPTNITQNGALNCNPVYHPDGRYLVFTSERDGMAHLYCWDRADPNNIPLRLTDNPHFEDQAAFSPDGKLLYFVSTRDHGVADIYVIDFEPTQLLNITKAINLTGGLGNNLHPTVAPDGNYIAFSRNRDHDIPKIYSPFIPENYRATNIYKLNLHTKDLTRLTRDEQWDGSPAWSKDGECIYFYSTRAVDGKKKPHIYSMNTDGENVQMVLPKNVKGLSPRIMPNGGIAFTWLKKGRYAIMSVNHYSINY